MDAYNTQHPNEYLTNAMIIKAAIYSSSSLGTYCCYQSLMALSTANDLINIKIDRFSITYSPDRNVGGGGGLGI
jgi:hypothetical protein